MRPHVFEIVRDRNDEAESLFADKHDAFMIGKSVGGTLDALRSFARKATEREHEASHLEAYCAILDAWDGVSRSPDDIESARVHRQETLRRLKASREDAVPFAGPCARRAASRPGRSGSGSRYAPPSDRRGE